MRNARELLRELDEASLLRRRIKLQAARALAAIRQIDSLSAPQLPSTSRSGRGRWDTERRTIEEVLKRISQSGGV
jgi:aminoglycoside phosphotransferase (APT) family kinase protein